MTKQQWTLCNLILGFILVSIAGYLGSWMSITSPGTSLLFPMVIGGQGVFFLFIAFVLYVGLENDQNAGT